MIKEAAEAMVAEAHKLNDESDGLEKRVGYTSERLKTVESQFEQDQESINEVNTFSLRCAF